MPSDANGIATITTIPAARYHVGSTSAPASSATSVHAGTTSNHSTRLLAWRTRRSAAGSSISASIRLGALANTFVANVSASIHVAMAAPNCHILEVSQGHMPMMWELFEEPFDIRPDGTVHAPDRPGLGFTLRADALDKFRYVEGPEYVF